MQNQQQQQSKVAFPHLLFKNENHDEFADFVRDHSLEVQPHGGFLYVRTPEGEEVAYEADVYTDTVSYRRLNYLPHV